MIEVYEDALTTRIVLTPNRSSDWRGNLIILGVLGSVCITIALAFYFIMDVWMILPFAGLEVLALAGGLYYASWKLNYQHYLIITDKAVRVEKGVYRPKGIWHCDKASALLRIVTPKHDWSPLDLILDLDGERISIGEFLGKDESIELAALLERHIQIRRSSQRDSSD